jgi:hypothetical protein
MERSSLITAALVCGVFAAQAQAGTTVTWNLESGLSGNGNNPAPNIRTKEVALQTISLQALYTNGTNAKLTTGSGSNVAGVSTWSGGVGICNDTQSSESNPNGSSSCGASPNHAIDNNGTADDFLLISFEALSWVDSLQLGWVQGPSDVNVYLAPETFDPTNLTNGTLCPETGGPCSAANSLYGAGSLGFQRIQFTGAGTGSVLDITPTNKTKYMLVSGALGHTNDYFKVSAVTAQIPEPGSLALLGLGGLGLLASLRGRKIAARSSAA